MYIGLNDRFNNNINENQFKDLYVNHNDYTMFDLSNNVIKSDFSNKSDINNKGKYLTKINDKTMYTRIIIKRKKYETK